VRYGVRDGVEDRNAFDGFAAAAGGDSRDDSGAVIRAELRVQAAFLSGYSLDEDSRRAEQFDGHDQRSSSSGSRV
jgi:hypothetical protein